ncbi:MULTISPECIES: type II toxin-antitoxin system HipA family toxin [Nitrincola]|uniref:Putative DNA-binding transcriptional regulator n=1 Tax=Nitrincola nitratireducens TaxID=1229521 RepID=W9V933_9GAMM|nr:MULTISPECIES: HipA domain-containing protein [Nitrincola]EXJ12587.1 putative DNA-binding transcriptional regulator [Nitrincola nitratireducens]
MELGIEIYYAGQWHEAAVLELLQTDQGRQSAVRLMYQQDYALNWMFRDDLHACSLNLPVELMLNHTSNRWFGFLDDIAPSGASRRFWVNRLGISHLSQGSQDSILLEKCTIAPVGNIRIHNAVPARDKYSLLENRRFEISDAVERQVDFLDYAQEMGAASGGATGAGGEAPKLLLRCSEEDKIWIDTWQDEPSQSDHFYLVKFPRGQMSAIDCDILRAEFHFYHELSLLGINTISVKRMRLIEGSRYPSLWLPRFDVMFEEGQIQRFGLESVYSILEKEAGSFLNHFEVIVKLVEKLSRQQQVIDGNCTFDQQAFVSQWLQRDLLNVIFANSDNHGRNTAFLKTPLGIDLSPIYDFAPMKADPEGIIRTMKWGVPFEQGGEFNWHAITEQLAPIATPSQLMDDLRTLASQLVGLKERLRIRGVSETLLKMPTTGMTSIEQRLRRWGLI